MATQYRDRRLTERHAMVMAGLFRGDDYYSNGTPRLQADGHGHHHNRLIELNELAEWGYVVLSEAQERWELTVAGHEEFLAPRVAELGPRAAADYLNVSPKWLAGLLGAGEIPFRQVGQRRLVREDDLATYKARDDDHRSAVADELSALGMEQNPEGYRRPSQH